MAKQQFFDINYYMKKLNITWQDTFFAVVIADRNNGKSTNIWENIENKIWIPSNYTKSIAYFRTNLTKSKNFTDGFNHKYHKKYRMNGNSIFKVCWDDETDKELTKHATRIGSVCGVMNSENYKSGIFDNYAGIFWDEFNEKYIGTDLWKNFIDLSKTIARNNNPFFIILCGNRVDGDNDILVNLDIEYGDNITDDYIQKLGENMYFIDCCTNKFTGGIGNQKDSLINRIAAFNRETDTYINKGGFLKRRDDRITLFKHIENKRNIYRYITVDKFIYEYGTVDNRIYFHRVFEDELLPDYKIVALDNKSYTNNRDAGKLNDIEDYVDFANRLKKANKGSNIIFTSNETMEIIQNFILSLTELVENN